jgi:hypothetical protein
MRQQRVAYDKVGEVFILKSASLSLHFAVSLPLLYFSAVLLCLSKFSFLSVSLILSRVMEEKNIGVLASSASNTPPSEFVDRDALDMVRLGKKQQLKVGHVRASRHD